VTSTTTRVRPLSSCLSFMTPRTVSRSHAYTAFTKAMDMLPPFTKPAPRKRVIISET